MVTNILVLMSVFNGQKYIREQIESILKQEGVEVHLLIRDDGSSDDTLKIINEYSVNDEKIKVIKGKNIGCINSFSELVMAAASYKNFDFYAFADQDDVWFPDKLQEGIKHLKSCAEDYPNKPLLYFCNMMIADSNAKPICLLRKYNLILKKGYILKANPAAGCTMVFNKKMVDIYNYHVAVLPAYHDQWMIFIAMFFGKVIYNKKPFIYYRQHQGNVVGAHDQINFWSKWKKHLFVYIKPNSNKEIESATAFLRCFQKELKKKDIKLIENFIHYKEDFKCKIRMICNLDYYPDCPFFSYPHKYLNHIIKIAFNRL